MAKKREKKWYEVLASKQFNNVPVGETVAYEDKNLLGRVITSNVGSLIRDPKLQNVRLSFKVNEVKENKAYTEIYGYSLAGSYVKRIIRVGRSRVDDSFLVETKDKVKIRLKPLVLTKYKTNRSILTALRALVKKDFIEYINKESYDKFVSDLVGKKLQRDLKLKLNKIYPIGVVEIRIMKRV